METQTVNPIDVIKTFYEPDSEAFRILVAHSESVVNLALRIVEGHPELNADKEFVRESAMLHDIGILYTDAPSIGCHGFAHYISHGLLGGIMLRKLQLFRHARVAERHTGSGLTKEYIEANGLPLPPMDLLPETVEEQIVCYADKFFSKSNESLTEQKSWERALRSVKKFGEESERRFLEMDAKLRIDSIV